ncbi:hypothetical protein [Dechloromonas denitrificans]|nr:hypothetical protein [Dechloromonas denitrificans]
MPNANSSRHCRIDRMTPCLFEKQAGRASAPPKSPARVTFAPRCSGTGRAREGRQVRRDDFRQGIIPMYTPEKETARPEHERAEEKAAEAGNLKGHSTTPASKLFAEADSIISTFPSIMTRKGRHKAERLVLFTFLAALAAGRQEMAV